MIERDNKNRLFVLLIFGMTIIPFAMAWLLGGKASFIEGQTNNGKLITPVVTTQRSDFIGVDKFSAKNIGELEGRWLMLNVVPQADCNAVCIEAIHKTKQLHLMMNKDLLRIRRVAVFFQDIKPEALSPLLLEDKLLLKVRLSQGLGKKVTAMTGGHIPDGILFLMDPMGNFMMQYEPGFDPYKVKSDLMHLLRISQIG